MALKRGEVHSLDFHVFQSPLTLGSQTHCPISKNTLVQIGMIQFCDKLKWVKILQPIACNRDRTILLALVISPYLPFVFIILFTPENWVYLHNPFYLAIYFSAVVWQVLGILLHQRLKAWNLKVTTIIIFLFPLAYIPFFRKDLCFIVKNLWQAKPVQILPA